MQHKKLLLILVFILVAMIQIYVPARMVYDSEVVLNEGSVYKFRTQPIDPTDPFRGKYITLRYDIDRFNIDTTEVWRQGADVFVLLTTDSLGFAAIKSISRSAPESAIDYVQAKVGYTWKRQDYINIEYSFNRFYMEESKAYAAEVAYRNAARDRKAEAYALVHIRNGDPIVKDVLIDGVSIREVVIRNKEEAGANF